MIAFIRKALTRHRHRLRQAARARAEAVQALYDAHRRGDTRDQHHATRRAVQATCEQLRMELGR